MGNLFLNGLSNENDNNQNNDNQNLLINQDNQLEIQNLEEENEDLDEVLVESGIDTLYIKELVIGDPPEHLLNPIEIIKGSLSLEQDAYSREKYYIKFNYDSILNFNCFISFKVKKNDSKNNFPNIINISPERYVLNYIPVSQKFNTIIIKNLPKGQNKQFLDKNAFIDLNLFNTSVRGNDKKEYDVSIEMVPIIEKGSLDYKNKNEIVILNLCDLFIHNGHYEIKIKEGRLKSYGLWFRLNDVFDSSNNGICLICYTKKCNTVALPCNHSFACFLCANHIIENEKKCPICKQNVDDIMLINFD